MGLVPSPFYPHKEEKEESKPKDSLGPTAAIILGLIGLLIVILTQARNYLPLSIFYFVVIVIALTIFIATVYGFLGHKISSFAREKITTRKYNNLAREFFPEFKDFVRRFEEFVPQDGTMFHSALMELANRGFKEISVPIFSNIHLLFSRYKERLKLFNSTKEDFVLLINEFDGILQLYHRIYIQMPIRKIRESGKEVPQYHKNEYKKFKENYSPFIRAYIDFCKKLNEEFETEKIRQGTIGSTYLEPLEEL